MLTQNEIDFITANEKEDTNRLLLNASKKQNNAGINTPLCVKCIEARRKIVLKIPLWYENPALVYPFPLSVEQCSSQATALYKQKLVKEILLGYNHINIADITGGMGIDSYFLSHIATNHYYIERNKELCDASQYNFKQLGAENIAVLHDECRSENRALFNHLSTKQLSIIYIDPARRSKTNSKVISLQDYEPNILDLKEEFFQLAPYLLIKVSPMADIKLNAKLLPETKQIYVISVDNECKELLFLLEAPQKKGECDGTTLPTPPQITAVNITARGEQCLSFTFPQEESATAALTSNVGTYVFEPNKSILKCGAYKLISQLFGLQKLAPSTHLYTLDTTCTQFPGKTYIVEQVKDFNKKEIKEIARLYPRAGLSARNFPLDTNGLRKLSGIKEGGTHHLFAVTVTDGKKKIIVCRNQSI